MKVLVPMHGFSTWNGGVDLMRVIVQSLRAVAAEEGLSLLFAWPREWPGQSAESARLRAIVRAFLGDGTIIECDDDGRGINLAAVDCGADCIFPTMLPIRTSHVRKIGYIYDFQHRDLPELFDATERERRDAEFADIVRRSDAMYCTSAHVAEGLMRHLGVPREGILVMPYTPILDVAWLDADIDAARARHRLDGRYLMLSNHFWVHKDHATAIRAFARLREDPAFADLVLVMTGDTTDFRDPGHYAGIQRLIGQLGVSAHCRLTGFIPKPEQIALLRGSVGLLQPTRYEGAPGGGSSYEAIGLGLPVLLSDIAVNREVQGAGVTWFRTGDAEDLARQLRAMLASPAVPQDHATLRAAAAARLRHTGSTLARFLRTM